jgi:hypothetical protein
VKGFWGHCLLAEGGGESPASAICKSGTFYEWATGELRSELYKGSRERLAPAEGGVRAWQKKAPKVEAFKNAAEESRRFPPHYGVWKV